MLNVHVAHFGIFCCEIDGADLFIVQVVVEKFLVKEE